jgi:hypothetical protein
VAEADECGAAGHGGLTPGGGGTLRRCRFVSKKAFRRRAGRRVRRIKFFPQSCTISSPIVKISLRALRPALPALCRSADFAPHTGAEVQPGRSRARRTSTPFASKNKYVDTRPPRPKRCKNSPGESALTPAGACASQKRPRNDKFIPFVRCDRAKSTITEESEADCRNPLAAPTHHADVDRLEQDWPPTRGWPAEERRGE